MGQKKKGFVLLLSIMVMVLAMAMPNDVEAARKKKPAVKTVELRWAVRKSMVRRLLLNRVLRRRFPLL